MHPEPGAAPRELQRRYPDVQWHSCTLDFALGRKRARSRFGGRPDLPAGMEWPRRNGAPMAFVAQVALDELPEGDPEFFGLPPQGMLYFFYDVATGEWGIGAEDAGNGRVLYAAAPGDAPAEPPAELPDGADFRAMPVRVEHLHPPADWFMLGVQGVDLDDPKVEEHLDAVGEERAERGGGRCSQMFGEPLEVQDAMIPWLYEHANAWMPEPTDDEPWILLLQLDSHEETGMNWGDLGRLYFWIREHDLRAGRFDRTWTILQSY